MMNVGTEREKKGREEDRDAGKGRQTAKEEKDFKTERHGEMRRDTER